MKRNDMMSISRRSFLNALPICVLIVLSPRGASGRDKSLNISALNITVLLWMFDEQEKSIKKIRAEKIKRRGSKQIIVVSFSEGRRLVLYPDTSVTWIVQRNNDRPSRQSRLLKRTFSYTLDALYNMNRVKVILASGDRVREQFQRFQTEEVIESVTISAMYDLTRTLGDMSAVSSVTWDETNLRFIVR